MNKNDLQVFDILVLYDGREYIVVSPLRAISVNKHEPDILLDFTYYSDLSCRHFPNYDQIKEIKRPQTLVKLTQ